MVVPELFLLPVCRVDGHDHFHAPHSAIPASPVPCFPHQYAESRVLAGIRKAPGGILADHRSFAPLREWDALFFVAIVQLVFQANFKDMLRISAETMWCLVITSVVFTLALTINMIHRFKTIPRDKNDVMPESRALTNL
jgi:hypothetical protein